MEAFDDYKMARMFAEARAKNWRVPQGIEYFDFDKKWVVRSLPRKDKRFGCDARAEAVEVPGTE